MTFKAEMKTKELEMRELAQKIKSGEVATTDNCFAEIFPGFEYTEDMANGAADLFGRLAK